MHSWLQKFDEIVRVSRFSRRTRAPGDPAENRMIVRNGTVMTGGIALSAARSKLHRHENAVRIVHVIAERFAMAKSASRVELASRLKSSHRADLQTQAPISAPFRFSDDLLHHRACNAFAQVHGSRSHRLNLAMLRVQLFQCSTAEELTVFPNTPKGNVRAAQTFDRQRAHTFRRRMYKHAGKMFLQQLGDLRPA